MDAGKTQKLTGVPFLFELVVGGKLIGKRAGSELDSTVEPLLSRHLGFKGCRYLRFAHISEYTQFFSTITTYLD